MRKQLLKSALALVAGAWAVGSYAQSVGDIVTYEGHKYLVTGENLITNGSFEDGFTGWTSGNNSVLSSSNFTLKTEGAKDGSQYLVGTKNDGAGGAGSIGTAWPIEGGKTYMYSFWIKSETGATGAGFVKNSLTNKAGDETHVLPEPTVTSDGSWCEYKVVFENTDNYTFCQARYRWLNGQWGFDDFMLAEVVELPNTEALEGAIAEAEALYSPNGEEAEALQDAITTAKGYLTSESTEEIAQATADLNAAIKSYRIANASAANPIQLDFPDTWANIGNPYNCGGITMHEKYAEQPYTGDVMWQTTTNLPNGIYEAEIYCVASACEWNFTSTITNGEENLTNIYGNGKYALTVPVVKQKSASTAGVYKLTNLVVSDGTLTITIKNDQKGANWILVANKSLTYLGFDTSAAVAALQDLVDEAQAQYDSEVANRASLPGLVEALEEKINAARTAISVATKTVLEVATDELKAAMAQAKAAEAPMAELKAALARNQAITEGVDFESITEAADAEGFMTAIGNAEAATYGSVETIEGIRQVMEELEAARQTFVQGAYPQAGVMTFDLTFKMANAAVTSAEGWNAGRINHGEQYTGAPDNTYLDAWNATFNMSQDVELPDGVYELKAATRGHDGLTAANIYVLADGVNYATNIHRVGNQGNELGNGWGWTTVGNIMIKSGKATIGFYSECGGSKWAGADNFQLSLVRAFTQEELIEANSVAVAALKDLIAEAQAQYDGEFENHTSLPGLVETLGEKISAAETAVEIAATDRIALKTATNELEEAMAQAKAAEAPMAELRAALADNQAITEGVDFESITEAADAEGFMTAIGNAEAATYGSVETIEELRQVMADLEAARQTFVLGAYPQAGVMTFDLTFKMANAAVTSAEGWTNGRVTKGEQYKGAPDDTYLDITWHQQAYDIHQTIVDLPDGIYTLKAATRAVEAGLETAYIYAQGIVGDKLTAEVHKVGASGNELGNGWGWTIIEDIPVVDGKVVIGLYADCDGQLWAGADNFQLSLVRAFTEEEAYAFAFGMAKDELAAKLEVAKKIDLETNVGDKAFQKDVENKEFLEQAIEAAEQQMALDMDGTNTDIVKMTSTTLTSAMELFEVLNQPADGDVFNVIIRTEDGYKFKDVPLTFKEDGETGAYFAPGFSSVNYAQSIIFTATDETNVYTMSTVFADGVRRYISTGLTSGVGTNTAQIRLTDDAEKALKVKVTATATEGIYTLYNTEAGQVLGCQDGDGQATGGLYTTGAHSSLALVQAEAPVVKLNITEAGFATLMLPFAAEVPEGLTVYACEAAGEKQENGVQVLTLAPVETIAANTPYIVEGAAGLEATFSGLGAAYRNEYAAGWLTGTFAETTAAANTYVLQNQAEAGVGFYAVEEGAEPTVGAYRAWLTPAKEEAADVKVFVLGDMATGIDGVAAADAQVNVYTVNGVLVRRNVKMSEALKGLNKGIYIVNGVKTAVK